MPIIRLDPDSSLGRQLQQLQTIYYAIIALPLLLFLLLYLQADTPDYEPYIANGGNWWLHLLVWLVVVGGVMRGLLTFNNRVKRHRKASDLEIKFIHYVRESRNLYVLLGLLMLLPVLAVWVTGVLIYGILFALLVVLVSAVRPTADRFAQKFKLSKEQKEELLRLS